MHASRVDAVARLAAGRFSRRAAVRAAGLGALTAGVPGTGVVGQTRAQGPLDQAKVEFLFVQTFESGTWQPKPGDEDAYLLTLTGVAAQTVYFSDRPERIVGTVPTDRFLAGLGFTPANPPNAALVARTGNGENVVVVELIDPVYAEDSGPDGGVTLTYEARVLEDYEEEGLTHLAARQSDDGAIPAQFGPAALFIDDCPDYWMRCVSYNGKYIGELGNQGTCWSWCGLECLWCRQPSDYMKQCNQMYPQCNNACGIDIPDIDFSSGCGL